MAQWTFLTNHAQVLLFVAQQPRVAAREIASTVGITERAVLRILDDLEAAGYIRRFHEGRNNRYEVDFERPLRHPAQRGQPIRPLLDLLIQFAHESPSAPTPSASERAPGSAVDHS